MRPLRTSLFLMALAIGLMPLQAGGPPYLTDDPVPVAHRGLEGYVFSTLDRGPDGRFLLLPASEFNYGALPGLQLHLQAAFAWASPGNGWTRSGWGDMEVGAKYRFLNESPDHPQIAFYPQIELPTGNAERGLGNGQAWYKLPLWAQKTWGSWTLCGGGGYAINHTPGARSYAFSGLQVERSLGERLSLGAEIFRQGAQAPGGRPSTLANLGGTYQLTERAALLFSAGKALAGDHHTIAYLGFIHTWGTKD